MGWLIILAEKSICLLQCKIWQGQGWFNKTYVQHHDTGRYDCIPRRGGGKFKSTISELVVVQKGLRKELDVMSVMVSQKDIKIANLKAASIKGGEEGPNSNKKLSNENAALHERMKKLEARVEALTIRNEQLT